MLQRFGGPSPSSKRAFCAPCASPVPKGLPPVPTTCRVGFGVFSVQPGCHSSGSIRNYLVYLPSAHRVKKTQNPRGGSQSFKRWANYSLAGRLEGFFEEP